MEVGLERWTGGRMDRQIDGNMDESIMAPMIPTCLVWGVCLVDYRVLVLLGVFCGFSEVSQVTVCGGKDEKASVFFTRRILQLTTHSATHTLTKGLEEGLHEAGAVPVHRHVHVDVVCRRNWRGGDE